MWKSIAVGMSLAALVGSGPRADAQLVPIPNMTMVGDDAGDAFGASLAPAGDVDADGVPDWIVGMPDDDNGADDSGSARVFSGADGSVLHSFDGLAELDDLGISVASAGDVDADGHADLIVGAWQDPDDNPIGSNGNGPGYALVFSGATGALLHTLEGDPQDGARFGISVAGVGDIDDDGFDDVIVGASRHTLVPLTGQIGAGRAQVFSGADGAVLFTLDGDDNYDEFGSGVAGPGDLTGDGVPDLLVGATGDRDNWPDNGSVALFSGADGAFVHKWFTDELYEGLGRHVAAVGDVNADGVPDVGGVGDSEVRIWSGADFSLLHLLDGPEPVGYDSWPTLAGGGDVDGDGADDFVVGYRFAESWGSLGGAVELRSGLDGSVLRALTTQTPAAGLGASVAILGDVNGDGLAEVLAGAPDAGAGAVQLHVDLESPRLLTLAGGGAFDGFGLAVGGGGDADDDGLDDLVIGVPYTDTTHSTAGRVLLRSGADGALLHEWFGDATSARLGLAVCVVGDVDHDGHADVAAGAPHPYGPPALPGFVRVWSGDDGALLHELHGVSGGDQFGLALAAVGDLDGDGRADLVVGAPADDLGGANAGAARAFSGASGALLWQALGEFAGDAFGQAVAGVGDVSGDGVPDVLVGAPQHDGGGFNAGQARLLSGADGALLHSFEGAVFAAGLGRSLAGAGDVDADGVPDLALGAPFDTSVADAGTGRVFVHSGADFALLHTFSSADPDDSAVGWTLAPAGDVDADGHADLAVGVSGADDNGGASGAVWVHSGATGERLHVLVGEPGTSNLGTSLAFAGDVDDDFFPDLVAGASAVPGSVGGGVIVFSPATTDEPWSDLGAVLPGSTPLTSLTPQGSLVDGSAGTLRVTGALPGAPVHMLLGFSSLFAPFKAGTLVPAPDVILSGPVADAQGRLELPFVFPVGIPSGSELWLQAWVVDAGGALGFASTQGVRGTTP